jgi:hypothetical protein
MFDSRPGHVSSRFYSVSHGRFWGSASTTLRAFPCKYVILFGMYCIKHTVLHSVCSLSYWQGHKVKKGREAGVYSALQVEEADCTLTPWRSSLIHLQKRHHTKRSEGPLLAKEGNFIEGILLANRNLLQLLGSFTCRKVGTWDRLFNFRRKACWGFCNSETTENVYYSSTECIWYSLPQDIRSYLVSQRWG